jgi:hypothetical protein
VGMAMVERARKGGPREVLAAFDGNSADPLGQLREEGEPIASQMREGLDRLSPGLGNPVMKVEVRDVAAEPSSPADAQELSEALQRIASRLEELRRQLPPSAERPDRAS